MSNWYKDLMDGNNKKKYDLYDKEGCAATGSITCVKGDCNCKNCNYAEQFLRTGKKVDIYNNTDNYKNINKLLDECQDKLNYSKRLLSDIEKEFITKSKDIIKPFCKNNNLNCNFNIHLSKAEKRKIREEHLRKYNTPKPKYIYKGNEIIDTDYKTYVDIQWNDGTTTSAQVQFNDIFNFGYGVLIATAKKFVKRLDLKLLESITNYQKEKMIAILELLILNTAGSKCLKDIREQAFKNDGWEKKYITLDDLIKKLIKNL